MATYPSNLNGWVDLLSPGLYELVNNEARSYGHTLDHEIIVGVDNIRDCIKVILRPASPSSVARQFSWVEISRRTIENKDFDTISKMVKSLARDYYGIVEAGCPMEPAYSLSELNEAQEFIEANTK